MKKPSVSIGIPAYNEEANIMYLLQLLLLQKQKDFILKEIIVYSDGSTDRTTEMARSLGSDFVKVFADKKRAGKASRQNKILKLYRGDILVFLDADVLPENKVFVNNLVLPIIKGEADLVSGKAVPLSANTYIEHIINTSVNFKYSLFESYQNKKSVYLCFGRARAFSKRLSKKLVWPETIGEDAYSYFYCLFNGFNFLYNPKAKIFYRLPTSIKDHIKQSIRFVQSKKRMGKYFDQKLVEKSYELDNLVVIKSFILYFIKNPFELIPYLFMYLCVNVLVVFGLYSNLDAKWMVSETSKKLK